MTVDMLEVDMVQPLPDRLHAFTGPDWEQEDDVTRVLLRATGWGNSSGGEASPGVGGDRQLLARFELASRPGNERLAMERVSEVVTPLQLPPGRVDRLKTAVAEATMNAMEHGNKFIADKPVVIEVSRDDRNLVVSITDRGGDLFIAEAEAPDLTAKLVGRQSPRGWGLFLIQNMVDEMHVVTDEGHHTLKLVVHLAEGARGGSPE